MSAEDEAVLRDPVLDAVVNPNATRRPNAGQGVPPAREQQSASAAPADASQPRRSSVGVRGITGSLTAFEIDEAMQTRSEQLMACVQKRPNRLGHVAGNIKFHIAVDSHGKVERARVTESDIGEPQLEQCLCDVVATAPFPAPAGQQAAEAQWQMSVDPLARGAEPIDPAEMEDAIARQSEATYETCHVEHARRFVVTAYINSQGRLTTLNLRSPWRGPARTQEDTPEELACLMQALGEWKHLPKQGRYAKTTFELRWMKAPEEPRGRNRRDRNGSARRNKRR